MPQILFIQASPRANSISHDLADQLLAKLQSLYSGTTTITRDLMNGLPLVSDASINAHYTPADQRTDSQKSLLATSDA